MAVGIYIAQPVDECVLPDYRQMVSANDERPEEFLYKKIVQARFRVHRVTGTVVAIDREIVR